MAWAFQNTGSLLTNTSSKFKKKSVIALAAAQGGKSWSRVLLFFQYVAENKHFFVWPDII